MGSFSRLVRFFWTPYREHELGVKNCANLICQDTHNERKVNKSLPFKSTRRLSLVGKRYMVCRQQDGPNQHGQPVEGAEGTHGISGTQGPSQRDGGNLLCLPTLSRGHPGRGRRNERSLEMGQTSNQPAPAPHRWVKPRSFPGEVLSGLYFPNRRTPLPHVPVMLPVWLTVF